MYPVPTYFAKDEKIKKKDTGYANDFKMKTLQKFLKNLRSYGPTALGTKSFEYCFFLPASSVVSGNKSTYTGTVQDAKRLGIRVIVQVG